MITAIGLLPGGSTHLHTNNTQNNTNNNGTTQMTTNVEKCSLCPVFASFILAFALQLWKKHGKTSVRVRKPSVRLRKTSVRVWKISVRGQDDLLSWSNLCTGLDRPWVSQKFEGTSISRQSMHEGGKVVSCKHRLSPPLPPLLVSVRGWVDPRTNIAAEELSK
jgi:hypothetical protein